jgi:long-chain acyl-CoA synthetase
MTTPRTLLEAAYQWERTTPNRVYMTQPIGGGAVRTYTWKQTLDEARRMAAHLRSLPLSSGSNIAILSKNCAHFIIADLAIWMAGHVSVALYGRSWSTRSRS